QTTTETPLVSNTPPQTTTTTETPPVTILEATSTGNQSPTMTRLKFSFASVHSLHEPEYYTEVVCDPLWQGTMDEELTSLHQTHTWDFIPLPAGERGIGSP
nr:Gag-Pol polyprotein [Tanacetum cinerariifolium]